MVLHIHPSSHLSLSIPVAPNSKMNSITHMRIETQQTPRQGSSNERKGKKESTGLTSRIP